MSAIAEYYLEAGIKFDKKSLTNIDLQFKSFEQRLKNFGKNVEKGIKLPSLNIDRMKLQRSLQTELNGVGRLLDLRIDHFTIDEGKLNKQLQAAFSRASQNIKLNVKSIAGQSGGAGVRPVFIQPHPDGNGSGFGVPPMFMPRMPMMGGMGAAGVGALAAGAGVAGIAAINNKLNEVQKQVSSYEMQRLQLGAAVGGSDERRMSNAGILKDIADEIGTRAEGQVDAYTKFQKQATSSGLSAREAILLYRNMALSTRGNGGDQQSIERQAYALQQVFGLGHLRGEELNQQLADSNPAIKKFIQQAYLQRVGFKGTDAEGTKKFMDDLGKRLVSTTDVLRGYQRSAEDASGRVAELSNSLEGAQARFENTKWMENIERSSGELTDSMRDRIAAEQDLFEASKPLRDAFYGLSTAAISLSAVLLKSVTENAPKALEQLAENPPPAYGLPSTNNVFQAKVKDTQLYGGTATNAGGWLYEMLNKVSPSLAFNIAGSSLDPYTLQPEEMQKWELPDLKLPTLPMPGVKADPSVPQALKIDLSPLKLEMPSFPEMPRTPDYSKSSLRDIPSNDDVQRTVASAPANVMNNQVNNVTVGDVIVNTQATDSETIGIDIKRHLNDWVGSMIPSFPVTE